MQCAINIAHTEAIVSDGYFDILGGIAEDDEGKEDG